MNKKIFSKYAKQEVDPKYYSDVESISVNISDSKDVPGVVFAPYIMCEHTEESCKEYNEFMDKYHAQHCCCPKCGSKNYTMTLAGYPLNHDHPEEYKDRNACHCQDCGWKGIAHELVTEKTDA